MTSLSTEALSVTTVDGTRLLADVSLEIESGETVLVCGASGSGKTMLAKALKGLLAGRKDLVVEGAVHRHGTIGYVAQSPRTQLVRRSVRNDVAFGPENRGVPADEIEDRIDRSARQLNALSLLDRRTRDLSGGETTIVAILGALVMDPDAVILDEPLASLDHRNTRLVLDAIDRLGEADVAIVIAEHDVRDLIERGDRAVLLEEGRIGATGEPTAIAAALHRAGVTIPFETAVHVERARMDAPELPGGSGDDPGVDRP